ncbi:MAG: hypothetical protein FWE80_09995 [Oscillospiraceae bacterium]|nr:hypothetical protein [Oscillospiraceae bacterium]
MKTRREIAGYIAAAGKYTWTDYDADMWDSGCVSPESIVWGDPPDYKENELPDKLIILNGEQVTLKHTGYSGTPDGDYIPGDEGVGVTSEKWREMYMSDAGGEFYYIAGTDLLDEYYHEGWNSRLPRSVSAEQAAAQAKAFAAAFIPDIDEWLYEDVSPMPHAAETANFFIRFYKEAYGIRLGCSVGLYLSPDGEILGMFTRYQDMFTDFSVTEEQVENAQKKTAEWIAEKNGAVFTRREPYAQYLMAYNGKIFLTTHYTTPDADGLGMPEMVYACPLE